MTTPVLTRERLAVLTESGEVMEWWLRRCIKCGALLVEGQIDAHLAKHDAEAKS